MCFVIPRAATKKIRQRDVKVTINKLKLDTKKCLNNSKEGRRRETGIIIQRNQTEYK